MNQDPDSSVTEEGDVETPLSCLVSDTPSHSHCDRDHNSIHPENIILNLDTSTLQ